MRRDNCFICFPLFGVRVQGNRFVLYVSIDWVPCARICVHRNVIIGDKQSAIDDRRFAIGTICCSFVFVCFKCVGSACRDLFLNVSSVWGPCARKVFVSCVFL